MSGRTHSLERQRISTPSGDTCAATLYRPTSGPEGLLPCVVMGPGGTLTQRDGIPDYAARFATVGIAALSFDYRHWGESDGEPRRYVSIPRQLADWHSAVAHARALDGIDPDRIVAWGMSLGGGHVLTTAAEDERIAAAIAFVPMTDGWRFSLSLRMLRSSTRALDLWLRRQPVRMPAAGPAGAFPPEELPSLERLAGGSGWRNEAEADLGYPLYRYRPVKRAREIEAPLLVQVGERDELAPRRAAERTAERAPRGELRRYLIDHFAGFWPEHIDEVAADQIDFLRHHLLAPGAA